jgi:hypothetical protein
LRKSSEEMTMRMSLLQLIKIVIGSAFATAYIIPLIRLAEAEVATWPAMIVVAAIGVPLVLALSAILLARRGHFRDALILVLSMTSVGVILTVGIEAFCRAIILWFRRGMPSDIYLMAHLAVLGFPVVVSILILSLLFRKLISRKESLSI